MRATAATVFLVVLLGPVAARGADDLAVWNDFSRTLRGGGLRADRIRPYDEQIRRALLEFIAAIREESKPEDWQAPPETHRVGSQIHFLIPLTTKEGKKTFCFTLLVEGEMWFFQHVESIFIRLDQVGPLPASRFPDVTAEQKNWIRAENAMDERLRLFAWLAKEKGKSFALQWFNDGGGYFMSARTWVPFVPAARAFILYLCWEQSNLQGQPATLVSLDDRQATVEVEAREWKLYEQTAQPRQMISREDYRMLYETVWRNRANAAGWDLRIEYDGARVRFRFDRT